MGAGGAGGPSPGPRRGYRSLLIQGPTPAQNKLPPACVLPGRVRASTPPNAEGWVTRVLRVGASPAVLERTQPGARAGKNG